VFLVTFYLKLLFFFKKETVMKYIVLIVISVMLTACDSRQSNESSGITSNERDSKIKTRLTGMKEYRKLEKKTYASDSIFDFETAKIYEIYCPGECHERSLFTKRTGKMKNISKKTFKQMMNIFSDSTTYALGSAACYHPSIAIITYDVDKNPMFYFGICLDCNNYDTNMAMDFNEIYDEELDEYYYKSGFSTIGRRQIRSIFREIDFEYPGGAYSAMFDKMEDVIEEMRHQGLDSTQIKQRIDRMGYELE